MPELSKDDLLSNLDYDLDEGYGSAQSLYKQAQEDITVSLEYVKNWIKNNLINKEKVIKVTTVIKHHFQDTNTKLILWI